MNSFKLYWEQISSNTANYSVSKRLYLNTVFLMVCCSLTHSRFFIQHFTLFILAFSWRLTFSTVKFCFLKTCMFAAKGKKIPINTNLSNHHHESKPVWCLISSSRKETCLTVCFIHASTVFPSKQLNKKKKKSTKLVKYDDSSLCMTYHLAVLLCAIT